ncbi:unnamed protein product [Hymenolepis diminuta]|uniref:RRM domain-containing protein n=1 Tax=Hymenolepis diminuta TaxID=6216 RepID=A0A564Z9A6_HYMDI|nr:unnamed protein product [Hymenolepis diminuta]
MTIDVQMESIDVEVSKTEPEKKLSKAAKRNLKRKANREAKKTLKDEKQSKANAGSKLPSSIVFPENASNETLQGEKLLAEIKRRINEKNSQTVRIMPVSKNCSYLLLQDLCPTSVTVRIPSKKNCRYAFVEFKTALEAKTAANEVNGKILDGKPIRATVCSERPSGNDNWKPLEERTLEDFDLSSLFVSNLPRFAERTDLAQIFRTADKINFMNMPDGTCKGFCILKYRNRSEALKAFFSRHGTLYRGIPIFVNFEIKSKAKDRVEKMDKSVPKDVATKSTPKTTDQKKKEQSQSVKEAEKANRKRKASGDKEEEASTEITLPTKKRRLEGGVEVMEDAKKDEKKTKQKVETEKRKAVGKRGKKFAAKRVDADFTIQNLPERKKGTVKLQPYQLARKKEIKQVKSKPSWK